MDIQFLLASLIGFTIGLFTMHLLCKKYCKCNVIGACDHKCCQDKTCCECCSCLDCKN